MKEHLLNNRINKLSNVVLEVGKYAYDLDDDEMIHAVRIWFNQSDEKASLEESWSAIQSWGGKHKWIAFIQDMEKGEVAFIHKRYLEEVEEKIYHNLHRLRTMAKHRDSEAVQEMRDRLSGIYYYHRQIIFYLRKRARLQNAKAFTLIPCLLDTYVSAIVEIKEAIQAFDIQLEDVKFSILDVYPFFCDEDK